MKIEKIILDTYSVNACEKELLLIYSALLAFEGINTRLLDPTDLYIVHRMTTELKIVLTPEA